MEAKYEETKANGGSPAVLMEYEHAIGYSTVTNRSVFHHPRANEYIHITGGSIAICDFVDPHKQTFLRHPNPFGDNGMELPTDKKSDNVVTSLATSKYGGFVAVGYSGPQPDVYVWDLEKREILWQLEEHDEPVVYVEFSHDERLLLAIDEARKLVVWDVKTGGAVCIIDLPSHLGRVVAGKWGGFAKNVKRRNTDLYQFATCGDSLCMWVLNPYSGQVEYTVAEAQRNARSYHCLEFLHTPDTCGREGYMDEWLVGGTASGDFVAYTVKPSRTGNFAAPLATFSQSVPCCKGGVKCLVKDPVDDGTLVAGGTDGTVTVFCFQSDESRWIDSEGFRTHSSVCSLSIDQSGTDILAATTHGRIYRATRGSLHEDQLVTVCTSHSSAVVGVAFSPITDEEFVTCSHDGTIKVWSMNDYSVKTEVRIRGGAVPHCVAFSFDAVISGWSDGKVRCHNANTGETLWEIKDAHEGGVTSLLLSGNKRFLVTGGHNGEVRVWELRMKELVTHLKEHSRPVTQIAIFEDDIHALTCSKDRSFLCWDLKNEKRITAHTQRMGGINAMVLNQDQSIVITAGQERNISFWDLREVSPIYVIHNNDPEMHRDEVTSIAVAHSGSLFATGGNDSIVKLWKLTPKGEPILLQDNRGHSGTVESMEFSKDDRQLVSVGTDGTIFVWNIYQ